MTEIILLFDFPTGRGSQAGKPINQILGTVVSKKFPSLQSSFKKEESTTKQDESTDDQNVKDRLQQSDDDDDGLPFRPSFSLDSTSTNQQKENEKKLSIGMGGVGWEDGEDGEDGDGWYGD